jgi:gluconate kinase
MFVFEELILKNKNISKLFYLYDELNSNKGLNESIVNEYINQSVVLYENLINKINPNDLKEIQMWVGHIQCENNYKNIDNLFSTNVLTLENKIQSKKNIMESLIKEPTTKKEVVNVSIKKMVEVANKTVSNYIDTLSESDKKELKSLLSSNDETIKESYFMLKGGVLSKLENLQESEQDNDVILRIDETIEKIKNESFDKMSYFKLRKLNDNL